MAEYTWEKLCQYVYQQPQYLAKIVQLLQYFLGDSCQKWYKQQTETEFGKSVLFNWSDTSLPQDLILFLAEKIYFFARSLNDHDRLAQKLSQIPANNPAQALKILDSIVNISRDISKKSGRIPKATSVSGRTPKETTVVKARIVNKPPIQKKAMDLALVQAFREETLCSTTPSKNSLWTRFASKKESTILVTSLPLKDLELETSRVETLVSLQSSTVLSWLSLPNENQLLQSNDRDLLKVINGIANDDNLSKDQRQLITQVKNALVIRAKLLSQPEIIINIINRGMRCYQHTLDQLSRLVTNAKVNKKLRGYLHYRSEEELIAHGVSFRREFENCQSLQELENLMDRYALQSTSAVKYYAELQIIRALKEILKNYQMMPQKLAKILNKYLSKHDVNVKAKLSQLLVTSGIDVDILNNIGRESNLERILQKLEKMRKQGNAHVEKLYQILKTFWEPLNKITFADFKTSLNQVSSILSKKILYAVRYSLQRELDQQVASILRSKENAAKNLQNLEKILTNSRYHDSSITLHGYPTQIFYEKINSVDTRAPNVQQLLQHIFSNNRIPNELFKFIAAAKKEQILAGKKNIENCHMQLSNLQTRINNRESLQLHTELVALLKSYGTVEFSSDPGFASVNGYELADLINIFYTNANRTTLDIPEYIAVPIRNLLKELVDQERSRQLKKMRS